MLLLALVGLQWHDLLRLRDHPRHDAVILVRPWCILSAALLQTKSASIDHVPHCSAPPLYSGRQGSGASQVLPFDLHLHFNELPVNSFFRVCGGVSWIQSAVAFRALQLL